MVWNLFRKRRKVLELLKKKDEKSITLELLSRFDLDQLEFIYKEAVRAEEKKGIGMRD